MPAPSPKILLLSTLFALSGLLAPASAITCANCDDEPPPPPRGGSSCLAEGTLISTFDGTEVLVERVRLNQAVTSLKEASSPSRTPGFEPTLVTRLYSAPNIHLMYRLTDSLGHQLTATDHHPVYTANRGMVQMAKLRVGDTLLTVRGRAEVKRLVSVAYRGKVYNLVVSSGNNRGNQGRSGSHTFFANGILVGDLSVQEALERD